MARILTEQGYVESYSVEPGRVGQNLRVTLKYTEDRKPVISGMERVSQARPAPLRRRRRGAEGPGWHGYDDRLHLARRDDGPRRPPRAASGGELVARVW